jgi:hypothetical protein
MESLQHQQTMLRDKPGKQCAMPLSICQRLRCRQDHL